MVFSVNIDVNPWLIKCFEGKRNHEIAKSLSNIITIKIKKSLTHVSRNKRNLQLIYTAKVFVLLSTRALTWSRRTYFRAPYQRCSEQIQASPPVIHHPLPLSPGGAQTVSQTIRLYENALHVRLSRSN